MFDLVGVTALVLLVVLFAWIVRRAWGARSAAVKWGGGLVGGALAVLCGLGLIIALTGFYKLNFTPHHPAGGEVRVAGSPEQMARGQKFLNMCSGCHSSKNGARLAGQNFLEGGPPFGTLYAPNLTPAGEIRDWSDREVITAIRQGIHKSGRPFLIMPSAIFRSLSDSDAHAIVAALRALPSSEPATPPNKLNVLGAMVVGLGMVPTTAQPPATAPIVAPPEGVTAEYGKYLVSVLPCRECHGQELAGGVIVRFGPPAGPNLTAIVPQWTEEGFIKTFRSGVDPSGHTLTEAMPWKEFSAFASDDDLKAMYAYLHGLKPVLADYK